MKTPNTRKPRHPDFDEAWMRYKKIFYWAAMKAAKILGGEAKDYWGILLIRFNTCLWGWNESKGKFSTYFMHRLFHNTFRTIKTESDRASSKYRKNMERDENFKAKVIYRFNLNELACKDHKAYYSWPTDLLLELGEIGVCSNYVLSSLSERQKFVIQKRVYEKMTLQAVGDILKVGRERVRQIEKIAIERIRKKMFYDKKFRKMMNNYGLRLPEYCYRLYGDML